MVPATSAVMATEAADAQFEMPRLRVFTEIPQHHHDVVALLGQVLVFDTEGLCREPIQDGALYVVEDQRPPGGASWEMFDRSNREHNLRWRRARD